MLRTDRSFPFYAGDGNPNVTTLFNILTTYALNHPSVSYCQVRLTFLSPICQYVNFYAMTGHVRPGFSDTGHHR